VSYLYGESKSLSGRITRLKRMRALFMVLNNEDKKGAKEIGKKQICEKI
jgi:hypothetical protein